MRGESAEMLVEPDLHECVQHQIISCTPVPGKLPFGTFPQRDSIGILPKQAYLHQRIIGKVHTKRR
jgi:hypothetical protein